MAWLSQWIAFPFVALATERPPRRLLDEMYLLRDVHGIAPVAAAMAR
jgi:hypothetical protein